MSDKITELIARIRAVQSDGYLSATYLGNEHVGDLLGDVLDALEAEHQRAEQAEEVLAGADNTAAKYWRRMKDAESNADEYHSILDWQSNALTGVVNAVRGDPGPLKMHSHHDAVELVQAVVAERDALRAALEEIRALPPTWPRGMYGAPDDMYAGRALDRILSRAIDTKED